MNTKKQTIAFWDKGRGTRLVSCSSRGFDIGLKSEGKDLLAKNFKATSGSKTSDWYEKWWMKYLFFPLIVSIIAAFLFFYFGLN